MNVTVPNSTLFWPRVSHTSFAIRCRYVEMVRGAESSPSFPSAVPSHGIPFPPQGLLGEEFPCFYGTMECSDSRSLLPPHFVFLRLAVPSTHERFAPRDGPCRIEGPGAFALCVVIPQSTSLGWKRSGLPSSWGTPVCVPCSQTPAGPSRQAVAARRCGLPLLVQRRLPQFAYFEAPWHGPHTRCLRFAGWITPPPRKTRFRLLASFAGQDASSCKVPTKGFNRPRHPPFPSFS